MYFTLRDRRRRADVEGGAALSASSPRLAKLRAALLALPRATSKLLRRGRHTGKVEGQ